MKCFKCGQVLIATSTLAWGVNFPAHLVVVKGTEYFDGKSRRYVDYPITGTYATANRYFKLISIYRRVEV